MRIFLNMLGGLNEITALELFTQNYLIWGRISFTIWKRIEFYVYPPGARLSRPPHRYAQGPYFFCEIAGLTRGRPGSDPGQTRKVFGERMCGSDPGLTRVRLGSDPDFEKHLYPHLRHQDSFTIIAPLGDDIVYQKFIERRNLENYGSSPSMCRIIFQKR